MKISKEYHAILNGDVNTSINNIVYDTVVKIVNENEELTNNTQTEQVEQVEQVEQSSELTNEVKEATPIKEVGKKGRPAKK